MRAASASAPSWLAALPLLLLVRPLRICAARLMAALRVHLAFENPREENQEQPSPGRRAC